MTQKEVIQTMVKGLEQVPAGTELTVYRLAAACGLDAKAMENDGVLFDLFVPLQKAARRAGITLDNSPWAESFIGLPHVIPFLVKK